jgi:mannose/fructose/N-acetylgalactosamine-specific phosphotransferase system component IIC
VTGTPLDLALLLLWGTVVGLDLVSVPQGLLARPLVAASIAGWIVGDPVAGMRVGALLELFALDVLPVGASRYPEYGPAAIGAALLAADQPWSVGVGAGGSLGLVMAALGGWSLQRLRKANARLVQTNAAALTAGMPAAIRRLQWTGLRRDALRAFAVTGASVALALAGRTWLQVADVPGRLLTAALVGAGVAAALTGAWRGAGYGRRLRWLGAGLVVGALAGLLL